MKHTYEKFIIKNEKTGEYIVAAPGEKVHMVIFKSSEEKGV